MASSYPQPPGLKSSTTQPHASLPARPPPSVAAPSTSFKPAFPPASSNAAASTSKSGYNAFTAFAPRSIASSNFRTNSPANYSAPPVTSYSSTPQYSPPDAYSAQPQYNQSYAQPSAPQIRNPFIPPNSGLASSTNPYGSHSSPVDPEMEAQILQWQSAYVSKDTDPSKSSTGGYRRNNEGPSGANTAPLGTNSRVEISTPTAGPAAPSSAAAGGADGAASKTVIRSGGGTSWQDPSLLEWDPAHFRLFVGNLAGEVTDDSLLKAFAKYPSVQKARVVRDKRTTKSKGYGFVSFSDGDEYFQAARDMQGKYIGSHPVLLRRSTTEVRAAPVHQKGGKYGKHGTGGGGGGGGKTEHGGVQKKQPKTKGGLRVLG
jgi:hypothetical protein